MALSTHLVQAFEHQQLSHKHAQLNPSNPTRQPFTPQYIIQTPTKPAPTFNPIPSPLFSVSHGQPVRGKNGSRHTIPTVDPEMEQKPPITQNLSTPQSHAPPHAFTYQSPNPTQLTAWDAGGSLPPPHPSHHPFTQSGQAPATMSLSEYTAGQIATLQSRLAKKLGPEYITQRPGGGGAKLSYIEGWKAVNLANEVFGFNGWSSQIISLTTDFCDELSPGRYTVGITAIVRITLRDGTFHEDTGYGHGENQKGKGVALDKAKKEAVTDGVKRALKGFGNVLGNCLYDREFLKDIQKVKLGPVSKKPLVPEDLWRRPEHDELFQSSAQAGPSRPHPALDQETRNYVDPPGQPLDNGKYYRSSEHMPADQNIQSVKDEQGFTKPALPSRLDPTTVSTPIRAPPRDPVSRAAGAQARAEALAAGMAITRPTTTEVENFYADDDEALAGIDMLDYIDDPAVRPTSTDLELDGLDGQDFGHVAEETREEEGMGQVSVRTDGFGAPPGNTEEHDRPAEKVGERPEPVRVRSAGGFVYPSATNGTTENRSVKSNIYPEVPAVNGVKKPSPSEAALRRAKAIQDGMNAGSPSNSNGSDSDGFTSTRGMKRTNPGDGDGFGLKNPGNNGGMTTARKVLGELNVHTLPDPKRIRS